MTGDEQYVVWTRYRHANGTVIRHAYGALSRAEALRLRRQFLADDPKPGDTQEISVCRVLWPGDDELDEVDE